MLTCHVCNKKFEKTISEYNRRIKNGATRFFCSTSCSASVASKETSEKNRHTILNLDKKQCTKCNKNKPLQEFNKRGSWYNSKCRDCSKQSWKNWYKNNRYKHIAKVRKQDITRIRQYRQFKESLKCSLCDENERCCLSFHHTEDSKDYNLSSIAKFFGMPKFNKELKKCVCVCHNCHSKIHAGIIKMDLLGFEPS